MKEIIITKNEENQRLDKFLLKYMNKASKGFIYKMLRKKRIKYNGGKAEGNELLRAGDTLRLYLAEETMQSFMEEKRCLRQKGILALCMRMTRFWWFPSRQDCSHIPKKAVIPIR